MMKLKAFTLAEVLITLGIIGVVAALTIPNLVGSYKRIETITRLKKFNSVMAQAVMLAESENGPVSTWDVPVGRSAESANALFNYLKPYIKYIKAEIVNGAIEIDFPDGSHAGIVPGGGACSDVYYYTNGKNKNAPPTVSGKNLFMFLLCQNALTYGNGRNWTTYRANPIYYDRAAMLSRCSKSPGDEYCSGLLEYDEWEVKDDYPYKF